MESQVGYVALFRHFSVIDSLECFWMRSLLQNILLMLFFLKTLFLALCLFCYTLMTFLMMLPIILLYILALLLFTLTAIRLLICGNCWNLLLDLNLMYKTLWIEAGSSFLISMLEKLNSFNLTVWITVLLMWKWAGLSDTGIFFLF